jgi:hypothetical protein
VLTDRRRAGRFAGFRRAACVHIRGCLPRSPGGCRPRSTPAVERDSRWRCVMTTSGHSVAPQVCPHMARTRRGHGQDGGGSAGGADCPARCAGETQVRCARRCRARAVTTPGARRASRSSVRPAAGPAVIADNPGQARAEWWRARCLGTLPLAVYS